MFSPQMISCSLWLFPLESQIHLQEDKISESYYRRQRGICLIFLQMLLYHKVFPLGFLAQGVSYKQSINR